MKTQHTLLLSLGTNMGDKSQNLQSCIDALHLHVITVVSVSAVYETPAWGFEGSSFYNCVIKAHTHKSPQKVLSKILKLEKELGRVRNAEPGYHSRIIDIDILAYDDEIISTENLTIPHPKLSEDRKSTRL